MGKQIYITEKEIEWLNELFHSLREMEGYQKDEEIQKVLDSIQDKVSK